ncbi:MAG TPA: hypothetical protein VE398_18005 [Acidobacteriota bacterium]|nr:hypothetical protein [Acidobacteriota bacterium]
MSQSLMEKFQIEGRVFETPQWNWAARVVNDPKPGSSSSPYSDTVLFELEFRRTDPAAAMNIPDRTRVNLHIASLI